MIGLNRHTLSFVLLSLVLWTATDVSPTRRAFAQAPDVIYTGGTILSCDAEMSVHQALAVRNGRVLALGDEQTIKALADDSTQSVALGGRTITPGLIDSHLHFVGLGASLQRLDLRDAQSWAEVIAAVEAAARLLPSGTWIEGRGWHQSKWNEPPADAIDGYPHHADMSKAVPDHPVLLTHASGHASFANQLAMKLAGITGQTSDPAGGEILRDANGQPTGVFRENAQQLVRRAQQALNRMELEDARRLLKEQVRLAGAECLRFGITAAHDAGTSIAGARALKQLADEGELPVRLAVMIRAPSHQLEAASEAGMLPRLAHKPGATIAIRSIKLSLDGALGPHGAWLLEPYRDLPESRGLNTATVDELERLARWCRREGWQLCVHAIGDRANREVLDAYESVLGDDVNSDHRWRVEHAQHLAKADIPRFGQLGVIPAMQANHCTSDAIFVPARLGDRRSAEGAYVWRSLIDSGAIIPNGTDAPVERVDPRVSLYAAVTRQIGPELQFYPDQCMSRKEALLSYTLWPAIAGFQEEDLGSLEAGKLADLVIWDTNLLTCAPEEILTATVETVWMEGDEVFQNEP